MRILNGDQVRQALPMSAAIAAMKQAYALLSAGKCRLPQRMQLRLPAEQADMLFMPASTETPSTLALKTVGVFPGNPQRGLPLIHAAVLVFDPKTGQPLALLEGSTLTAIRTGAGSGAAIDLLANPASKVVAIFGAGVQAHTQLEAACTVRAIEQVWIYDRNREKAEQMAAKIAGQPPIPLEVRVAESPAQAAAAADIICTATTSQTPVFADADLKPGVHICAIGAYRPDMREIPPETLGRARVFVDSLSATQHEAGDLLFAIESGQLALTDLDELGDLINGKVPGRKNTEEITVFKSVGVAVQDALAAHTALQNAAKLGLGVEISFS